MVLGHFVDCSAHPLGFLVGNEGFRALYRPFEEVCRVPHFLIPDSEPAKHPQLHATSIGMRGSASWQLWFKGFRDPLEPHNLKPQYEAPKPLNHNMKPHINPYITTT